MNVCLISREYPPFFGGGIGTYNVQWAKALAAAGHRVIVVTVSDDGTVKRDRGGGDGKGGGITVVRLPLINGNDWSGPHPNIATPETVAAFQGLSVVSPFAMEVEKRVPDLCRQYSIDIIEVPDTGALAWFGLNNRRCGGTWKDCPPVVTTIHSPSAWIAHHNRQPTSCRSDVELAAMERDCALWSDALVSPSAALAEWTRQNWGIAAERIETIPYPLGDLARSEGCSAGGNGTEFRALFIGRLEPRKGVDTLLESLSKTNGLDVTVDLVGEDTPDPARPGLFGQNSLRDLVPEGKRGRVRIHGRKNPDELPALRDAADVIVIPSPMDNFPYVCVEAMAEGRLVIASSAGGTGEMIRDGVDGYLFAAGDAGACAAVLERAARSTAESRAGMRESAWRRIREYCGNEGILERRVAHYRRTLERARATEVEVRKGSAVVVVNRAGARDEDVARLKGAMDAAGVDFAHGWPRLEGEVFAHSTPSLGTLSHSPRILGPVVVRVEALREDAVHGLLEGCAGEVRTSNTWVLALALCASGRRGVCVPDVVVDVARGELHPCDRTLVGELNSIHMSRAWRVVNRVYDVLHVLRGRGWRRPYDRRGRIRPSSS